MAPPKRPWFRWYVEMFSDVEIRALTPAQRWAWGAMLGISRTSPVPGMLLDKAGEPMTAPMIADFAAVKLADVRATIQRMLKLESLRRDEDGSLIVSKWDVRQFESDDVASRVAKHRSNAASNDDVTGNAPPDVTADAPHDETFPPSVVLPEIQSSTESSLTGSTGHPLLAPGRPPQLSAELDQIIVSLADQHGQAKITEAVDDLLDDHRRFPWPSDARKALEALLGTPPPPTGALDAMASAQQAIVDRNRRRNAGEYECDRCQDQGVRPDEAGDLVDCECKYRAAS